jgi:hypothetical protein
LILAIRSIVDTRGRLGSPEADIALDVEKASRYNGTTVIRVVTFQKHNAGASEAKDWIRLCRHNRISCTDGAFVADRTYTLSMPDFDALGNEFIWLDQLDDLIKGKSDRAVKHIRRELKAQDQRDPPVTWKRERMPPYEQVMTVITRPINASELQADARRCAVCWFDFEETGREPLTICHEQHVLCKDCLLKLLRTQRMHLACPYCRQEINSYERMAAGLEPALIQLLKYGVIGKNYIYDDRYTEFENFERSMCDLDEFHASQMPDMMKVDASLLRHAWQYIKRGLLSEPGRSTPLNLQPVRFSEHEALDAALNVYLERIDGMRIPVKVLLEMIMDAIHQELAYEYVRIVLAADFDIPAPGVDALENLGKSMNDLWHLQ